MRKYLYFASGIISTILAFKLFFRKPPPSPDYSDLPQLENPDESSSEENNTIKRTCQHLKLSHMKKQDLIDECISRNIACVGTVRVLRERLRDARDDEQA